MASVIARNAILADEAILALSTQLRVLETAARERGLLADSSDPKIQQLQSENAALRKAVADAKQTLIDLERSHGRTVVDAPSASAAAASTSAQPISQAAKGKAAKAAAAATPAAAAAPAADKKAEAAPAAKDKGKKAESSAPASTDAPAAGEDAKVHQLDFRVGRIVSAKKHPDADSLYVEEVDLNEGGKLRTVVSGLVKFVPIEQMQNRLAVLLCNLKPAKMRGVLSEAMVMCASTPDKVEILDPPAGAVPGDRIVFAGHEGKPDEQLNPKKKTWETLAPMFKTNDQRVATFNGVPFSVDGKGVVSAPTLANVQVK
ncbi:small inducible cytokine subfamily E [Capsaspora owczarzaki ATCC 30864]|uniref:Small inducible cytokine subfamily E n=1 Tax=Capsaspora owczarzaki (strain ATCC 30864) TaxID=595528 RepID=A0A0D2X0A9_CAPO3|nr:small inducible cytokine subfamily E [Capsaspora owczarzaki ATCC 30864]KJE88739.1 small inducible cytokine subfamily E [Capsaspora owczarzaki ATCC 30864]|eukprot:XP_004365203.1 small inducible cytokine subfamily E [Capsaspora owczarzaki ATCC 30864]